jgi:hypothetical protein
MLSATPLSAALVARREAEVRARLLERVLGVVAVSSSAFTGVTEEREGEPEPAAAAPPPLRKDRRDMAGEGHWGECEDATAATAAEAADMANRVDKSCELAGGGWVALRVRRGVWRGGDTERVEGLGAKCTEGEAGSATVSELLLALRLRGVTLSALSFISFSSPAAAAAGCGDGEAEARVRGEEVRGEEGGAPPLVRAAAAGWFWNTLRSLCALSSAGFA